jgi:putative membrane protein
MKSPSVALASLLSLAFAAVSLAEDAAVKSGDKSFLKNAYEDGLAEVKAGEMAVSKSANEDVKAFGKHMVDDHAKANAELKTLADSKKVEVPTEPSTVAKGKAKLLEAKSGADFDKAFAKAMVSDHEKAVEAFAKAANKAEDADVKAFAAKTLPTLQGHLKMAQELQAKLGK